MRIYPTDKIPRAWFTAFWLNSVLLFSLLVVNAPGHAQQSSPDEPVYVVQSGDNAWDIARRFGVSLDDLAAANGLADLGNIAIGQELIIPGLSGVHGYLQTVDMPPGESARSLSRKYGLPLDTFNRLNRLTSPQQLYAGASVILLVQDDAVTLGRRVTLREGETPLQVAAALGISPWELALRAGLPSPVALLPKDVLLLPGAADGPAALPPFVHSMDLNFPLVQGQTINLRLQGGQDASGSFLGFPLHFFSDSAGMVTLQGILALQTPGLYPLQVEVTSPDGGTYRFEQNVLVLGGDYLYDPPFNVPPEVIDPAVTVPEDAQLHALTAPVSAERRWQGMFSPPVDAPYVDCWPSRYGSRRSYNNSGYIYFHTGLDFCGQVGYAIYAAADGVVVFAGETIVRGNMTVIDHGWGVYTVYMHQSKMDVQAGDVVTAGQRIGSVGATGRVTGPHLHFEVWVNGVQVDPWLWLTTVYP
ncbi:MAG: M23 family metallopeptidase [Anaerolineales bacterium]